MHIHSSTVEHRVSAAARAVRNGHKGGVVWLTGLPGAGKTILIMGVEQRLFAQGYQVFALDGDNVRHGLNADLGFSPGNRAENIRRVSEVAALFAEAGLIAIAAFISPYRVDRERARAATRKAFTVKPAPVSSRNSPASRLPTSPRRVQVSSSTRRTRPSISPLLSWKPTSGSTSRCSRNDPGDRHVPIPLDVAIPLYNEEAVIDALPERLQELLTRRLWPTLSCPLMYFYESTRLGITSCPKMSSA